MRNNNNIENSNDYDFVAKNKVAEIPLDFKMVIGKVLSFLPIFILSIGISLLIAWTVTRYSDNRYLISGSILLKEKGRAGSNMGGMENFIEGMQLLSVNRNIENEVAILKSKYLVQETLKQLDFGISYFGKGTIKQEEYYRNCPFGIRSISLQPDLGKLIKHLMLLMKPIKKHLNMRNQRFVQIP